MSNNFFIHQHQLEERRQDLLRDAQERRLATRASRKQHAGVRNLAGKEKMFALIVVLILGSLFLTAVMIHVMGSAFFPLIVNWLDLQAFQHPIAFQMQLVH